MSDLDNNSEDKISILVLVRGIVITIRKSVEHLKKLLMSMWASLNSVNIMALLIVLTFVIPTLNKLISN